MSDTLTLTQIVEALLFTASEPVALQRLREAVASYHPVTLEGLRTALDTLKGEYESQKRAFALEELAEGYILRTRPHLAPYLEAFVGEKRLEKLSPAATEVLAIIAYRQPITRPQVEALRGIDCSGVIHTLLERQLIATAGRLEAPGRPSLFVTTKQFLVYYGLKSLKELPSL